MPSLRFTDSALRALRTSKAQEEYWDSSFQGAGFGVRVSGKTGAKKFILRYSVDGDRRRMTLGSYPGTSLAAARERARRIVVAVDQGDDPAEEKRARLRAPTFNDLAALYIDRHAKPNKRSWRYDERMLDFYLRPAWENRKAADIGRADVIAILDEIMDRDAPQAANRVRALASRVFSFGIERGIVETNPVTYVRRPAELHDRDRVLSEKEIRRLWAALEEESWRVSGSLRLRLLTLQRGNEVVGAQWDEFDDGWWTIPAERSKNKHSHRVPLSSQALRVLESVREHSGDSVWLFPALRGPGHFAWVGKAAREMRDRLKFDWTPHDLRRTGTSMLASMGFDRTVLGKVLNHAGIDRTVTAVYDRHSYDDQKRQALVAWGQRVEEIVTGRRVSKVVARIG